MARLLATLQPQVPLAAFRFASVFHLGLSLSLGFRLANLRQPLLLVASSTTVRGRPHLTVRLS